MTREINTHKVNGLNEAIKVETHDEPGNGGAHHHYTVGVPGVTNATILFQNGAIKEAKEANGISNESLLAVVIDRLQCFQKGPFACRENAIALTKLEESMHWLQHRTLARVARGVEGTHKV